MISLVNSARIKSGKPTLGWLNPTIYTKAYHIFNDITTGKNNCLRFGSDCCLEGFRATPGWDPVTGWGSINFGKFQEFFLSIEIENLHKKHSEYDESNIKRNEGYLFLFFIFIICIFILYCFYNFYRTMFQPHSDSFSIVEYGSIHDNAENIVL